MKKFFFILLAYLMCSHLQGTVPVAPSGNTLQNSVVNTLKKVSEAQIKPFAGVGKYAEVASQLEPSGILGAVWKFDCDNPSHVRMLQDNVRQVLIDNMRAVVREFWVSVRFPVYCIGGIVLAYMAHQAWHSYRRTKLLEELKRKKSK